MPTTQNGQPLTTRLNNGLEVLTRLSHGEPYPMTYANRTQADRARQKLGDDWYVWQGTRPFFVAKVQA